MRQFFVGRTGRIGRRALPADSALRMPLSLFGVGDLERVPTSVLREYADADDDDRNGISGRMVEVPGGVGRFGWKARFATLEDAVGAALVNELGLTTTRYPRDSPDDTRGPADVEVSDDDLRALTGFVRSLPSLTTSDLRSEHVRGKELFERVGCAGCHRPTLHVAADTGTGRQVIHPYTDLLLHDMGPALADGIAEGEASPQEFRTPPLWGISRTGPPYLHDGRAKTIREAILMHGGEAQRSADAFAKLPAADRVILLKFIGTR